jgi:hypothetical protein
MRTETKQEIKKLEEFKQRYLDNKLINNRIK